MPDLPPSSQAFLSWLSSPFESVQKLSGERRHGFWVHFEPQKMLLMAKD